MAIIQSGKVDSFLARPPEKVNAVLIYGPDRGLVSERAAKLAAAFNGASANALAITRLTASDLNDDPGRLADEVTSMGLFGGRRVVRVRPESQQITNQLEQLLPRIDRDILLIVEAGQLAPNIKMRKLFETAEHCAAIPCYLDDAQDLGRILDEQVRGAGLTIDADARAAMMERIGGDRMASRAEIEKLCLYALGRETITLNHVEAIAGDVSTLVLDDLCDAVGLGDLAATDRITERLLAGGTSPHQIIASHIRHVLLLHELRAATDAGGNTRELIDRRRPPVFFKRKPAISAQVRRWPLGHLNRALEILGSGEQAARRGDALAPAAISQTLLTLCYQAKKLAGNQARNHDRHAQSGR
ncbi:MAG: DNA polymerase III subunit delta [Fimbriimonadaceae bacterium]|nr:DNA polymerase III subunit delta [Alphaproteobacteria bacterium]